VVGKSFKKNGKGWEVRSKRHERSGIEQGRKNFQKKIHGLKTPLTEKKEEKKRSGRDRNHKKEASTDNKGRRKAGNRRGCFQKKSHGLP